MNIAIIGQEEAILGFRAIGVESHAVSTPQEAVKMLQKLKKTESYAIIFITEDFAGLILSEISTMNQDAFPAITIIPTPRGSQGIGFQKIRKVVERAVGIDLLG